jgi:16S rRNA processing protein RimM
MLIAVGKVRSAHGLKGLVKVEAFAGSDRTLKDQGDLYLGVSPDSCNPYKVETFRKATGDVVLIKFEGINSPDDIELIKGLLIFISEEKLPVLPKGSFYSFMLEGLQVFTTQGELLGKVVRVDHYPANDILAVIAQGGNEILIPAVKDLVRKIELKEGRIIVEDRKGLR